MNRRRLAAGRMYTFFFGVFVKCKVQSEVNIEITTSRRRVATSTKQQQTLKWVENLLQCVETLPLFDLVSLSVVDSSENLRVQLNTSNLKMMKNFTKISFSPFTSCPLPHSVARALSWPAATSSLAYIYARHCCSREESSRLDRRVKCTLPMKSY